MKTVPVNHDGIRLYFEDEDDTPVIYFEDWLKEVSEWGAPLDSIRCHMLLSYEWNEIQIDEAITNLEEEFYDYCDENNYLGETV